MPQSQTTSTYYYIPAPPRSPIQPSELTTMPFFSRQVDFDLTPAYSRLPRDDEVYVMEAFAHHASHCSACANPYEVHKRGGTLCAKGHLRALDVAQYLYNKGGRAFSSVDLEGNQRIQVEIPSGCEPVRGLLKAMERGLRLRRRTPTVSYDETYYVPARKLQPDRGYQYPREPRSSRKPHIETVEPSSSKYSKQQRREKTAYPGRGSLYEEDMREREKRYKSMQAFYPTSTPRRSSTYTKHDDWH